MPPERRILSTVVDGGLHFVGGFREAAPWFVVLEQLYAVRPGLLGLELGKAIFHRGLEQLASEGSLATRKRLDEHRRFLPAPARAALVVSTNGAG